MLEGLLPLSKYSYFCIIIVILMFAFGGIGYISKFATNEISTDAITCWRGPQ